MKATSLDALGALKQALRDAAEQAAKTQARANEQAARALRERHLFALSVGPVAPLRKSARRCSTRGSWTR